MVGVDNERLVEKKVLSFFLLFVFITLSGGAKKCESPWRTFKNVCFLFSDTNNQKFKEAQEFCYKKNAFLASIRNSAENGFVLKTIQGMGSSYQRVRWFIGLYQYDPNDNKAYRWLDGSVSNYRNWMRTQPNSIYERCAQLDGSNGFQWRDDVCTHRALFICRKDLDEKGSMNCFKGRPPPSQILEKKGISVTECIEHCRGQGFPLAGVIPDKCYCLGPNNLKNLEEAVRSKCSGLCQDQHCGNNNFVTIYNLTFYKDTAESCEDLSNLGFSSPSTYVTKVGDEERLSNCFTDDTRYAATSNFHISDLSSEGTPVYSDGPVSSSQEGPDGFAPAADFSDNTHPPPRACLKLSDLAGVRKPKDESLKCWRNPALCTHGFSAGIWAKLLFNRNEKNKRYLFSTGGDDEGIPGVAVYYKGVYLYALVSTGEAFWSSHVAGLILNNTWSNIAFAWNQKEGLDLYINGKQAAHTRYPEAPRFSPKPPMKPLQLTLGCRRVKKDVYNDFIHGMLDEFVTWQQKISKENASFFLGGMDPSSLCKPDKHPFSCSSDMDDILKKIDETDMSNIDIAMATIMHVAEVAKKMPKRRRGGSGNRKDGNKDGNNSSGNDKSGKTAKKKPGSSDSDQDDANIEDEEDEEQRKLRMKNLKSMIAIVKKLVNKTSGAFNPGVNTEDLSVLYKMQEIVSSIFSESNMDMWKQLEAEGENGLQLVKSVQKWSVDKLVETSTEEKNVDLSMFSESMVSWSAKSSSEEIKKKHKPYIYFPDYMKDEKWKEIRKKWDFPRDQLRVTTKIFDNKEEEVSIHSVLYKTFHTVASRFNSITGANTSHVLLDSRVINFVVKPSYNQEVLQDDAVVFILDHQTEKTKHEDGYFWRKSSKAKIEKWECVRWSEDLIIPGVQDHGGWTTDGCAKVNTTSDYTTCACNTLGMFALLALLEQPKVYSESEDETWVYVLKGLGYTFSIITLICYISAIAMRPSLHDQFHIIRLNMSIAAVGTMVSLFSVDFKRHDWEACRVLAGFIHYFYLAYGCWMAILTHALFKGFIRGVVDGRVCFYMLVGWGLPLVYVGVVVASNPNYGYDDRCMVGPSRGMRCSLACPLVFFGMSSLVWSTVVCCNLNSPQIKRIEVVQELNCSTKMLFCLSFSFSVIWILGFIALLEFEVPNKRGFRKLFQIFNSWLGMLIVFFIGLGSRHFRYAVFDKYIQNFMKYFSNQVSPSQQFEYTNGYRFEYKNYYYH